MGMPDGPFPGRSHLFHPFREAGVRRAAPHPRAYYSAFRSIGPLAPERLAVKATNLPAECAAEGSCLSDFFHLLGKAHVLGILHYLLESGSARRFVEIQDYLSLSPNTLTDRLKELAQAGLITRTSYNEIPPRVDYQVTAKAKELAPVFETLCEWAVKHDLRPEGAPAIVAITPRTP
jgi:DNA-binding HxlR family transcriptional regulator